MTSKAQFNQDYILSRIVVEPVKGCWLWQLHIDRDGYGRFDISETEETYAHRGSYQLFVGNIPFGLEVDHLCRVRNCLNPDHLEAVTKLENTMRGIGPTAANSRKTHCCNGHPFDEENSYRRGTRRMCRACNRISVERYRAKQLELMGAA